MKPVSGQGKVSSGEVEGFNTKAKLTLRKSYGFRTFKTQEVVFHHALGNLPPPDLTTNFSEEPKTQAIVNGSENRTSSASRSTPTGSSLLSPTTA